MSIPRKLSDLRVYVAAMDLGRDVSKHVERWPWPERHDIGRQLVRSTDSIAANIAEGYGRHYPREKRMFLFYARSSAREVECWLDKALDKRLINAAAHRRYTNQLFHIVKMLAAYIRLVAPTGT